jgi:hypothetical protein
MSLYKQEASVPAYAGAITSSIVTLAAIPQGKLTLSPLLTTTNTFISFIRSGFASTLCFTSAGNAAGTVFTITGAYNGNYITENVVGPNVATVSSINFYDTIISIVSSTAIGAVDINIGYGNVVAVRLNNYNFENNITKPNLSFGFFVSNLTAAGAPGIQLFGVTNVKPQALQVANFTAATRPSNFQLLTAALTQAQVNAGYSLANVTYQYATVFAVLTAVVTPTYVEIMQL